MRDYMHLYRRELLPDEHWPVEWDVFVSAYDRSERVRRVFDKVRAGRKFWLVHEEYGFAKHERPAGNPYVCRAMSETSMLGFWRERLGREGIGGGTLCVDATGFMRPQLLFFLQLLLKSGVDRFDVLYSEPAYYKKKDETDFSDAHVEVVRQVVGFEGESDVGVGRELLIIGAGYETHLVAEVAEDKDRARKVVLFGLPSVRADMYQQSVWRTWRAVDVLDGGNAERYFAPASDPLATATVVSELVARERSSTEIGHVYLSPLATNAQAVGFALCYLTEYRESNTSIIFPFTRGYQKETSIGFARAWVHTLEF